jgi:hypothetical protein
MGAFLRNTLAPRLALGCILAVGYAAAFGAIAATIFALLSPLWEEHLRYAQITTPIVTGLIGTLLLSPLLLSGFAFGLIPLGEGSVRSKAEFDRVISDVAAAYLPPLAALCLLSLALAIWTFRRQSGFSRHGAVAWAMFVFIWGVPGIVAYLLHRHWPASETCEKCGKLSPRDRDACLHCGTAFPPPAMKEIEIFA